ncbi:hypothetical protein HSBAA_PA_2610 (plasmid) [Vreelandella sulfidaeris]|uniref:Uncharacterized protein n=1 Tax=Vreelandella sulfidaeris TaxID=115553 RepID=A0A455UMW9_9GAMM|nr:hypothetical protein HSBAA_PA_2610 [Halomonas sulfidaeris]
MATVIGAVIKEVWKHLSVQHSPIEQGDREGLESAICATFPNDGTRLDCNARLNGSCSTAR